MMKNVYDKVPYRYIYGEFMDPSYPLYIVKNVVADSFKLHWHEFYEMEFILNGEGLNIINGEKHRLKKGTLFLLTPADFHEVIPEKNSELNLINIKFSDKLISACAEDMILNHKGNLTYTFDEKDFDEMEREMELLLKEYEKRDIGSDIIIKGCIERAIIRLIRQSNIRKGDERYSQDADNDRLHKSLAYIHYHFREQLTLEAVARLCHLNPNYFSEYFHKSTGFTFQNYVQDLRLQFASKLLLSSRLSITEICLASGFNNLSHFLRVFKKVYGQSPNSYRKNII